MQKNEEVSVPPPRAAPSFVPSCGEGGVAPLQQVHDDPPMASLDQRRGMLPIASEVSSPTPPSNEGVIELSLGEELMSLWFYGVLLDRPLWEL